MKKYKMWKYIFTNDFCQYHYQSTQNNKNELNPLLLLRTVGLPFVLNRTHGQHTSKPI